MTAAAPPRPGPNSFPLGWDLDVFVAGAPKTKGSMIAIKHKSTGRAVAIPSNTVNQREWTAYVRDAARMAWADEQGTGAGRRELVQRGPVTGPVQVRIEFVMPRRKTAPKGSTPAHTRKPDGDKLERCVWDALSGIVWADDAQVVSWSGSKREAELDEQPGARIRVVALPA